MAEITTQKYIRKPIVVDAVQVTPRNFEKLAAWCGGEIQQDEVPGKGTKRYIKVQVQNPKNPRQTKASVGDWILYSDKGYKVYTNKAFLDSFDLDVPRQDGDVTVLGSEVFVSLDESVICYKGVNYYQHQQMSVAEAAEADRRRALEEAYQREQAAGSPTLLEPGITPPITEKPIFSQGGGGAIPLDEDIAMDRHRAVAKQQMDRIQAEVGPDVELVEATPEAIAEAVVDTEAAKEAEGPTPTQADTAPPARHNGKRVLTLEEQRVMSNEDIRALIRKGNVVLAQDIVP